jgi:TRAP-type transport system periplasmic protein
MMKKTAILAAVLAGLTLPALAADPEITIKFSHTLPAKHPVHPTGFVKWGEAVTAASGGSIKFAFFPASQLGQAKDQYDMARDGIADMVWANPGHAPGRFPIAAAGEIPFLMNNGLVASRAYDEWYKKYAEREMGDVHVCMMQLHDPGTFHTRKPLHGPADLKSMKIRPANGTVGRYIQAQGGANIQVGPSEARDVLAKGTADGITFPWRSVFIFGMEDYVKHHIDMPFYVTTFAIVMNKRTYQRMAPAQKKVIDEHCTPEWAEKITQGWVDFDHEGRRLLAAAPGHTVYKPTAPELEAWKSAAEPLRAEWIKSVAAKGVDGKKAFADLLETLKKYDSLY